MIDEGSKTNTLIFSVLVCNIQAIERGSLILMGCHWQSTTAAVDGRLRRAGDDRMYVVVYVLLTVMQNVKQM